MCSSKCKLYVVLKELEFLVQKCIPNTLLVLSINTRFTILNADTLLHLYSHLLWFHQFDDFFMSPTLYFYTMLHEKPLKPNPYTKQLFCTPGVIPTLH